MKPIDPSTHPSFNDHQHLQDLHVLALFAKLSKRKPDAKQKVMAGKRMAKEMSEFTERLYNPTTPEREISQTEKVHYKLGLQPGRTSDGMFLSMLSSKGQVLWECESSDPKLGNTLFVFEANAGGQSIEVMFDSGASGNFIPKSIADKLKLSRVKCPAVKVTVASNTIV